MTAPTARRLARGIWGASVVLLVAGGAAALFGPAVPGRQQEPLAIAVAFMLVTLAYASVGMVVAARRPRNAIGWIFLALGAAMALGTACDGYAAHALYARSDALPAGETAAWVADFIISGPGILFGPFVYVFLLFPTGTLRSPRWRVLALAAGLVIAVLQLLVALAPGPLAGFPSVLNPLGMTAVGRLEPLVAPLFVGLFALLLAAALSPVLRFREAHGTERLQLKWFAAAAAALAVAIASAPAWWLSEAELGEIVWPLQFAFGLITIPVACAVAILRYRLYDIDRIVSRTVAYALLTAVLAAVYLGAVLALSRVLAPLAAGGSELAVAGATLAAAAVFAPARRRIQDAVDRRFNRARYDAQRELEAFAARLRDQVRLEEIGRDLVIAVTDTLQPRRVSLWLTSRSGP